jgi:tetratricopeptide (TPR) repeat protein
VGKPGGARIDYLICVLLAVVTLALYWQTLGFDFTHFDDNLYVTDNPEVQGGLSLSSIAWAFTHTRANNWHPVTWLSHMADYQIAELDPAYHHFTSVALHLANAILLFALLNRLTGRRWRSAFVAALFAAHPLHVESVAWVAERKDVLSTLFWLLTTMAYVSWARSPSLGRYLAVVLLFALGLLSKPMLVTLPLTLILLDFWPLGRLSDVRSWRPAIAGKTTLFVLAVASAITTFVVQRVTGAVGSLDAYPLGERLANALVAYVVYIKAMLWPTGLACFYPHPGASLPLWQPLVSAVALAALTYGAIRLARCRPYLILGWLWYLITLLPVIGIVQVGKQAIADRYTYIPLIGIFIAVTWWAADLITGTTATAVRRAAAGALGIVVVAALLPITYRQIGYWQDDVTLWNHALAVTKNNAVAHYNLATTYATQGDFTAAERHFREAVRVDPRKHDAHNNLGVMLLQRGDTIGAERHFRRAVNLDPGCADARNNLASVLFQKGRYDEAIKHYEAYLRLVPGDEEAIAALREAREIRRQMR